MAHFAFVQNGIVQDVIVVNDDCLLDEAGIESEAVGIAFLQEIYGDGSEYVQTSYNASRNGFRGEYAGIGFKWDGENFISPSSAIEEAP